MTLVVASAELSGGNVLTFKAFPTHAHMLSFVITFHVAEDVEGQIAYRVRKWGDVIQQTDPVSFHPPNAMSQKLFTHSDSIEVVFPGQGAYLLDILFDGSLLHSIPFSVFDNSQRTDLEREIIYYLKAKHGARSVQEITRGVFNPKILNKANSREASAKIYFALLRMKEVTNIHPAQHESLEDGLKHSRWQLKD